VGIVTVFVAVPEEWALVASLGNMTRVCLVAEMASVGLSLVAMLNLVASFFALEAARLFAGTCSNASLGIVVVVRIKGVCSGYVNGWDDVVFLEGVVDVVDESHGAES